MTFGFFPVSVGLTADNETVIGTVAGNGSRGFSEDGAPATEASLFTPFGVAVAADGTLYIAEFGSHRVRKVNLEGVITTVAGDGQPGFSGDGGPAGDARLWNPHGVALDAEGNLYIADAGNHRIRKIDVGGVITTVVGTGVMAFTGDGGPASRASVSKPASIALGADGTLFVADTGNHRVRRVDGAGIISTIAGVGGEGGGTGDGGPATEADLKPYGMAFDNAGNLYVADLYGARVRRIDTSGIITTVAGRGADPVFGLPGNLAHRTDTVTHMVGVSFPGVSDELVGDGGPATEASVGPIDVAIDPLGRVLVADRGFARIRRVELDGTITTVVGNGWYGYAGDGGPPRQAHLAAPTGVFVDTEGNLSIADTHNHRIRRVVGLP